ncbi:hypothetical protein [Candidatus Cryosericum hinesii]|jgi:hypothetical protein|uniref:Uncharacterized protein n=1 Tax=Candidatus Cryosericum hinesii TaxID=2290915 RepID=A0ABX9MBX9_9BACT|nr:hypothetical protein [Candidatus Cryosericum hinesii]RIE11536.1 hypothetical protein SMC2_09040 [Candidatus Cryosericum hinesii]
MAKDLQEDKGVIVSPETLAPTVEPKPGLSHKRQPRYWVRLAVFLVPLILSEIMFWHVGRTWNLVIFPVAWVAYFYFQMKRGGWNVFKP